MFSLLDFKNDFQDFLACNAIDCSNCIAGQIKKHEPNKNSCWSHAISPDRTLLFNRFRLKGDDPADQSRSSCFADKEIQAKEQCKYNDKT